MTSAVSKAFLHGRQLFASGAAQSFRRNLHNNVAWRCLGAYSSRAVIQVRNYSELYFTKKHEYVLMESDTVGRVGISEYAQDKLGDIVYVQLPEVGKAVEKDEEVAAVESVKAASEIYSPVSGQVAEVNEALESDCSLVNKSPLADGWIFKLSLSKKDELKSLLSQADYEKFLQEEEADDH